MYDHDLYEQVRHLPAAQPGGEGHAGGGLLQVHRDLHEQGTGRQLISSCLLRRLSHQSDAC